MSRIYNLDRKLTSEKLLALLEADNIVSSDTIRQSIRMYSTLNMDIVDIKLSVLSKEHGNPVLTWDKRFAKLDCEYYSPRDIIKSKHDHSEEF